VVVVATTMNVRMMVVDKEFQTHMDCVEFQVEIITLMAHQQKEDGTKVEVEEPSVLVEEAVEMSQMENLLTIATHVVLVLMVLLVEL
tara:strand:- start:62 stop:322 length:261 start_codon:yes stop_codon:yes gene_type:complete